MNTVIIKGIWVNRSYNRIMSELRIDQQKQITLKPQSRA